MKRLWFFPVLVIVAVFIFAVQRNKQSSNSASSNQNRKVSLRLKWLDQAQFAGFYMAKKEGLYGKSGLDVSIFPGGPEVSPIQMVITKVNDFGITGADQMITAREKGLPVVALAVIYKDSPVAIGSLKKSGIIIPSDLVGKKMGVAYGRDEETIYRALLTKEKIDSKKINEVSLSTDQTQLTSGAIDAEILYEMNEPVLLAQRGYEVNLIKPRDYGIKFYSDVLFTTEDMINNHREDVKNFVKASIEGWKDAYAAPEKAIDEVLSINNSLDRNHQTKFLELSKPLIVGNGDIGISDKKVWEEMQETLFAQGIIKNRVDLDKVFTNDFLK